MNKQVLRLALPSILANITIPLVGLVDTAIVGHISDAIAIGGIAVGTMLFDLLYWNFGFLRVGTSGLTAQAYGGNQMQECVNILLKSLLIVLFGVAIIWSLQRVYIGLIFLFVPCSHEVADFARNYFFIRVWAAPATLSIFTFKGWFIGMQDTVSSMIVDIVVNVVNIVASYFLVIHTSIGLLGVAHGTVIAQYSGLLMALGIIFVKYRHLFSMESVKELFHNLGSFRHLLSLNTNLYVRSICFIVIYVGFTSIASKYGNEILAVSNIIMKLFMFFSFFIDGFAYAAEALVGKYIGMIRQETEQNGAISQLKTVIKIVLLWSLGIGLFFTFVFAFKGMNCVGLITTDIEVLETARAYIGWLVVMPILSAFAFMWDGVYIGATAGKQVRDAMLYAVIGFVGIYFAFQEQWGVQALYLAYIVHLFVRTIYLSIVWNKTLKATIATQ